MAAAYIWNSHFSLKTIKCDTTSCAKLILALKNTYLRFIGICIIILVYISNCSSKDSYVYV